MLKQYKDVKAFHEAFNHPVGTKPQMLTKERMMLRLKWLQEEVDEAKEATTWVDQIDALTDAMYFIVGTFVEMGVNPDDFFDIVHGANMSKLVDGKPIYKEDGKVAKPEGWVAPEPQMKQLLDSLTKA